MRDSIILKIFDSWLEKNRERFLFEPMIYKRRKRYLQYSFKGITPALYWFIDNQHQSMICADYKGEIWDIIAEFDVWQSKNKKGYYCSGCEEEDRKYYKNKSELWIDHCFEPLIEWTNNEFTNNKWLCFFAMRQAPEYGSTWYRFSNEENITDLQSEKELIEAVLIKNTDTNTQLNV
jgi:hypothetical protein